MSGGKHRRGVVEDQALRLNQMFKASEQLTSAGLVSATVIIHPTEGPLWLGEEDATKYYKDLVER